MLLKYLIQLASPFSMFSKQESIVPWSSSVSGSLYGVSLADEALLDVRVTPVDAPLAHVRGQQGELVHADSDTSPKSV